MKYFAGQSSSSSKNLEKNCFVLMTSFSAGADDQLYKTKKSFLKFEVKIQGGFTCSSKSFQRNCEDKCYSELKKE